MHCHGIALWRWLSWHRFQFGAATALVGVGAASLRRSAAGRRGARVEVQPPAEQVAQPRHRGRSCEQYSGCGRRSEISLTDIGIHAHSAAHRSSRRPEPGTARPPAVAKRGSNATHAPPTRGWRSGQRAVSASCGAQASPIPSRPRSLLAMASLTHHLRRAGVCVASGYGIKVFVQRGQLVVEDGIGRDRRRRVFNRATHGISRLSCLAATASSAWKRSAGCTASESRSSTSTATATSSPPHPRAAATHDSTAPGRGRRGRDRDRGRADVAAGEARRPGPGARPAESRRCSGDPVRAATAALATASSSRSWSGRNGTRHSPTGPRGPGGSPL